MKRINLEINSWIGTAPGASHYFGRLRIDKETIDVDREITKEVALALNRDEKRKGDSYRWSVGGTTIRFHSEAEVIARAIEMIAEYPDAVLFEGSSAVLDPQPVLHGPEPLKTECNQMVAEAEANDWWEGDEETMEAISERWMAMLKTNGLR